MRQKRRSYRGQDDDEDAIGEDLAAVHERLDDLTRHLERIAQSSAGAGMSARVAVPSPAEHAPDRVADALARLDRRLDQVINETRAVETERQARFAAPPPQPAFAPSFAPPPAHSYSPPPPPQPQPSRGPANWAAQISARQRALDGGVPAAVTTPPPPPAPVPAPQWGGGADIAGLEQQLRQINNQISSLHHPYENALSALRGDLAEIGRALTEAMPRRAIEPLEAEVRALSERLDKTRQAGADGASLAALERGLAEVRDALRGLTPAESLVGFEDAVRALSHKIDQIAGAAHATQDPLAFKQLEQAVVSLRGVVSNVASDGALAQLAAEVHAIGSQFERAAADSSTEALTKLESRIASLVESGRAVPPELEGSIRALSERLDRMQLSQGDQLALGALEDRIAKLSEKLDASDARLAHLDAIERGLADLLVHLEENRNGGPRGLRAQAPAEAAPAAAAPTATPNMPEAPPLSPLDMIPDMPAPAPPMFQPPVEVAPAPHQPVADLPSHAAPAVIPAPPAPEPQRRPPMARPMPRVPERPPIDPNLPPDTPLEPGSGIPRSKPGSAAARIAASEAALGNTRPAMAESGGKSAAIAAARNAAKAAYLDTPVKVPKSLSDKADGEPRRSWFKRSAKKTAKSAPEIAPPPMPQPMPMPMPHPVTPAAYPAYDDLADAPPSRGRRVLGFFKKLLIAASVAIIVLGAVQTALEFLLPDQGSKPPATQAPNTNAPNTNAPNTNAPSSSQRSRPPATAPSRPMPTPQGPLPMPAPQGALPAAPAADPSPTGQIGGGTSFFDPSTVVAPRPQHNEVTGSIARQPLPSRAPAQANPSASHSPSDTAPAVASLTLTEAAAANDPAAEYEMGVRYAEGRGVPQSFYEAVRWLGRSANAGFVPAQFRLASLNEKGEGLKKDVQAARRLYMAAASKGHAKAMHNLAVLYAEGIDGKPDYKVAAQWFRKAAGYGVTDSQYNLAILYARGIGMQANLAESYKWFALAATKGDSDAARKRDEVAARLDQQTLAAAKLAAQTFVPDREPEEATNLRAPPGGWDRPPATPAKPRRRVPGSTAR